MSGTMVVEFAGGPLDGERMELPVTMREYRVPVRSMPEMWMDDGSPEFVASMMDAMQYAVYAPTGAPFVFHWQGIPDSAAERRNVEKAERAELARLKAKYESE